MAIRFYKVHFHIAFPGILESRSGWICFQDIWSSVHRCVLLLLIELSDIILFIRFAPKLASNDLKLKKK